MQRNIESFQFTNPLFKFVGALVIIPAGTQHHCIKPLPVHSRIIPRYCLYSLICQWFQQTLVTAG
jgi:hypothetical protein